VRRLMPIPLAFGLLLGACSKSPTLPSSQPTGKPTPLAVYMYSEYIDPEIPKAFENLTGTKVRIDVYEATEEMMAKLQQAGGVSQYDVVIVSDHAIPVLAKLGLIRALDRTKLPNIKNVSERFRDPPYDPGSRFSVPYQWGTMGLMYRKDKVAAMEPSWAMLFDPTKQPGPFLLIDSMRDMMAAALKYLGLSVNSRNPQELKRAGELILRTKKSPKALGFEGGVGGKNKVVAGEAILAIVYNGDAIRAIDEDKDVDFVLPKEGTIIWVDAMTIPAKAPNPRAAHTFINFILDAKVGAQLSDFNRYATPNAASLPLVSKADRENPGIYPPDEMVKKMEYLQDVGKDTRLYDEVWTAIKAR
jgi:spermidine/putrescine transport system substrate-binding protein